jgi:outer membrane protein OmpA-like peptidoglycan-associated protein
MESKVIDRAKEWITPEMVQRAASSTGELPENVGKAIGGAILTILAGLSHRASTPEGASSLQNTFREKQHDYADLGTKLRSDGDHREIVEEGHGLVRKVFGDRTSEARDALAHHSGVKSSTAMQVLAVAAPLVASALAPEIVSVGVAGLVQALASRKTAIAQHPDTPPGVARMFEEGPRAQGAGEATGEPRPETRPSGGVERRRSGGARPHWGMLAALAAVGLAAWGTFAWLRGPAPLPMQGVTNRQPPSETVPPVPEGPTPPVSPSAQRTPTAGIHLPNGKPLDVAAGTPEADFARALGDKAVALPHRVRFDSLRFQTNSSSLSGEGKKTIDELSEALHAYPSSRVRIDGFTDNVGSHGVNQALSEARARSVRSALTGKGIARERIQTVGAGKKQPVAKNDSAGGRTANRRSEVVLLSR